MDDIETAFHLLEHPPRLHHPKNTLFPGSFPATRGNPLHSQRHAYSHPTP